jgi:phage baseplate assembly protein W
MNPDFGVGLRNFLFEPEQKISAMVRQRIVSQTTRYMPFVTINKILFNHGIKPADAVDSNVLAIVIEFHVPSLNLQSEIQIQAEDIN